MILSEFKTTPKRDKISLEQESALQWTNAFTNEWMNEWMKVVTERFIYSVWLSDPMWNPAEFRNCNI